MQDLAGPSPSESLSEKSDQSPGKATSVRSLDARPGGSAGHTKRLVVWGGGGGCAAPHEISCGVYDLEFATKGSGPSSMKQCWVTACC